ncbi:MAG: sulfatase-like hydrolase/transferase, partial [Thermoplasmata archaeon]|nr:sulfatase-like hydrolase/transferase [Thermoplasmata archaeon]
MIQNLLASNWEDLALSRLGSVMPPDVYLIVLDSVSGLDVLGPGSNPAVSEALPGLCNFSGESVTYPEARTTASGSLAAHASAFTGLYPWVHGVHPRGAARLPERASTIAMSLGKDGYGTFSLSSSPVVSDSFGLTHGFKHAAWGRWADRYLRALGGRPAQGDPEILGTAEGPPEQQPDVTDRLGHRSRALVHKLPLVFDATTRALGALQRRAGGPPPVPAAWIEPAFESILSHAPDDVPLFGFVNLLDPSAPYFGTELAAGGGLDYFQAFTTPQDERRWEDGGSELSRRQRERLRLLYESALAGADRRLEGLFRMIRRFGRWENSLIVVTSDRGSRIARNPEAPTGSELDEQSSRIPLLVKYPGEPLEGERARGAASLIDLLPTVLGEVELD